MPVRDRNPAELNPAFDLSPFFVEWLAAGRPENQLPISSVCNCHCLFCSNDMNPFQIVAGRFRDLEDIKLQLSAMKPGGHPIRLSDSLPGRISEGEALVHPRLLEILDAVRRKYFYSPICFTTNGSMLDEAFLKKLAAYRPVEITLATHTLQPALWAKIFRKSEKHAHTAIAAARVLRGFGMDLAGAMVPMPRLCGWDDIDRTFEHFASAGAKSMILWWPGHSLRTPESIVREQACELSEFQEFVERMRDRFHLPMEILPDMVSPLPVPVKTIVARTLRGNPKTLGGPYRRVVWLSSRAAFARLQPLVDQAAAGAVNRHHVVAADNLTYRGNIMAAGLLMVEDFIQAGRLALEQWPDTELFLVPALPFDRFRRDLTGAPAYRIAESLGRPVWLVMDRGEVDTLLSFVMTETRKAPEAELQRVMKAHDASRLPDDRLVSDEPSMRRFELLDSARAVCMDSWLLKDRCRTLNRWTRLIKADLGWRVESVEEGAPD
jgi:uncharacterized Fe-S cluster-containing radical SAM superfamily protein